MLKPVMTLFILTFAFTSCAPLGDEAGTNTLIKEGSNQLHYKKAILFLKESGATVADSYQVTIVGNSHKLDKTEVGNTFTVDTNHGDTRLDQASIGFTWLAEDTLQINYDKKLRAFLRKKKINGVVIVYKAH